MIARPHELSSPSVAVDFLELMPPILRYLEFALRKMKAEQRADATQEALANCYVVYQRLVTTGRAALIYPQALARYAVRHYYAGRRVGSRLNVRDISSRYCQQRKKLCLVRLDSPDSEQSQWKQIVVADHRTPVFHQVRFKLDFSAWIRGLSPHRRALALFLARGNTTSDAAQKFRVSRSRISQLRQELMQSWSFFLAEKPRPQLPAA